MAGSWASGKTATPSSAATMRREAVVDAALAAHLAGNPFQHLGVDVDGLDRSPALDAVSGDSATVRGGTGRPDSEAA